MAFWLERTVFDRALLETLRTLEGGAGLVPIAVFTRFILRRDGYVCEFQIMPSDADVEEGLRRLSLDGRVRFTNIQFIGGDGKTCSVVWCAAA